MLGETIDLLVSIRQLERMPLTPSLCRAARGLLDWSQDDLAARSGLSVNMIRDFERGARQPYQRSLDALQEAFSEEGVEIIESNRLTAILVVKDSGKQ